MAVCFACFALLLSVSVVREAGGVISGPLFPRDKGLIEPVELEIPESEELPAFARRAMQGSPDRLRRQTSSEEEETDDHIGTLTPLTGDRHTFALVHWTGHPSEDIFILTRRRNGQGRSTESWLWRSTDYGKTFVNETDKFDNDTVIEWYYISPDQANLIMMDRINQRLWVTTDEGETYNSYPMGFTPDLLLFQSTLAPGSLNGTLPLHVLGYDGTARELWMSQDLGVNWQLLDTDVVPSRYYWRVLGGDLDPATAVYYEKAVNDTVSELRWSVEPYQSSSNFDEELGHFAVNTFVLSHEYMLVQKTDVLSGASEYSSPLWVSHNRAPFQQAQFPLQTPEKHYSVVDASEGQIFIAVYHTFNSTNLYLSEEAGLSYALSLEFIVSPPESDWVGGYPTFDVHVVEGIVGTYIANRQVPGSDFGATVISFDKGGEWSLVTPPASDYNNRPIHCVPPECSLHLHMESDRSIGYQSILSQDSAIGLIMALGNLGSSLQRNDRTTLRLYFSHDGGFSWQEVEQQFWEFQFAALGSIVVTIPKWQQTNIVRWSCDEGALWNETHFVDEQIRVVGMLTERGEKANHVTVFGYSGRGFTEWLVIDLNFTQVVPNQCLPEEDYYVWIPTDERPGSRCLLGEVVQYERRKSEVCCVVDPSYEKPVIRDFCACAIEDFECDFGFERVNLNSPCTPMDSIVWPPLPPPGCRENETYSYTSGYRKVAGDKCVPGNETYFFPTVRNCPVMSPLGLFIQYSPSVIAPGNTVTFTLTQLVGSKLVTHYYWNFNDSSPMVNGTGLEQSQTQTHAFQLPGVYTVKVTAMNDAGQSEATVDVSVLDSIQSVHLYLPPAYEDGVVPVGTELALQANYSTEHGTKVVGDIFVVWNYGDSASDTTVFPSTSHTYSDPGNYSLSVTVRSPLNSISTQRTISAVQAPLTLTLTVNPDQPGAKQIVTFNLQQDPEFTGATQYTYDFGDNSVDHFSSLAEARAVEHTYQHPGQYDVKVTATNIAGQGAQSITITVLDFITAASVAVIDYPNGRVPIGIQLLYKATYDTQFGTEFNGRLSYNWDWGDGSTPTMSHTSSVTHVYSDMGSYTLNLIVSNDISSASAATPITTFTPANPQIISDGAFFESGFVEVKASITLNVDPDSGELLPNTTVFTWNVSGPDGIHTTNKTSLTYDFPLPGRYQVSVMGNRSAVYFLSSKTIMAEYLITAASVAVIDYPNGRVPIGIQLLYKATYDTQFGTEFNGRLSYNWDWGDGSTPTMSHTSSVTHVYSDMGSYTLNLIVSNDISSASAATPITTFTPANPQIISDGAFFESGFVEVKASITLNVDPDSGELLPNTTVFTWNVSGPDGIHTTNKTSLTYDFPLPGRYQVSVMGNRSAVYFLSSKTIMAEHIIVKLDVDIRQTVHADNIAIATVNVSIANDEQYIGPLNLTLMYNGSYQPGTYFRNSSGGMQQLSVNTGKSGTELGIVFRAGNDISSATLVINHLVVVGPGQFGSVRLSFNTDPLPDDYHTEIWQTKLLKAISDYLMNRYSSLAKWQLEFSIHMLVKALNPTLRQSGGELLLVDFNVLPRSLDPTEINSTIRVAKETVDMVNNKGLSFNVDNQVIAVEKAELSPDAVIIAEKSSKNYLPLGAGLGGGLILLVVLAIIAIVATVYYRRKYSRLRVRYTRLQQGPVRFTFTPGGHMVEEDDDDYEEDEGAQMETLQSDDDEKPVL